MNQVNLCRPTVTVAATVTVTINITATITVEDRVGYVEAEGDSGRPPRPTNGRVVLARHGDDG